MRIFTCLLPIKSVILDKSDHCAHSPNTDLGSFAHRDELDLDCCTGQHGNADIVLHRDEINKSPKCFHLAVASPAITRRKDEKLRIPAAIVPLPL
jgi:hypothetical protein